MRYCYKSFESEDKINEILNLYREGNSIATVNKITENMYGISRIATLIKKRGLSRDNHEKSLKYSFNENFFDCIDTEEKAYWLGFIYADGYIANAIPGKIHDAFGMALSSVDEAHLEKFKNSLDSTHPIHYYTSAYGTGFSRITFLNQHFVDNLISKGVLRNKSLILTFPSYDIVPKDLIVHFIRGYFDGDGSIKKTGKKRTAAKDPYDVSFLGTKEFLEAIQDELGMHTKLKDTSKHNVNNHEIVFGGYHKALSVLNLLYENASIYLDRKYERYLELKNVRNSRLPQ